MTILSVMVEYEVAHFAEVKFWANCFAKCIPWYTKSDMTLGNTLYKIRHDFGLVCSGCLPRCIEALTLTRPTSTSERGITFVVCLTRRSLRFDVWLGVTLSRTPHYQKSVLYSKGTGMNEYQSDPFLFVHDS